VPVVLVHGSRAAGAVWRCRTCNEALEPRFTTCRSCGTERGR